MSENAHGHLSTKQYVAIWGVLLALLFLSLGFGRVGHAGLAVTLIFGVAAVKAALVLAFYMHLKFEPRFVQLVLLFGLACVLILAFLLVPDIVYVYGRAGA